MNSARERGALRIRQATAALVGAGVAATGAAVVLAHQTPAATSATSSTSTSSSAGTTSSTDGNGSTSRVQVGVGNGAPQAQSGGS